MNFTSATPLMSPPIAGLVMLEGRPLATVTRVPVLGSTFDMRAVKPPVYGPTGGGTCWHWAAIVCIAPPSPPSAMYRAPSGPNVRPRGCCSPVATKVMVEPADASASIGFNPNPTGTTSAESAATHRNMRLDILYLLLKQRSYQVGSAVLQPDSREPTRAYLESAETTFTRRNYCEVGESATARRRLRA